MMEDDMKRHEQLAEKIITAGGLVFALASSVGKEGDLREARRLLKDAIVRALEDEFNHGCKVAMNGD
jgi:hypothetical protein